MTKKKKKDQKKRRKKKIKRSGKKNANQAEMRTNKKIRRKMKIRKEMQTCNPDDLQHFSMLEAIHQNKILQETSVTPNGM